MLVHHSGVLRAARPLGHGFGCLKVGFIQVVPGKRKRDPGSITTAFPWCRLVLQRNVQRSFVAMGPCVRRDDGTFAGVRTSESGI